MNWIDEANKKLEEQRANFQESLDSGETRKRKGSYAASCVSKENTIKKAKLGGDKNVKSGHIQSLNDYPRDENQRSEAGKLGGSKNVETGWIKEAQSIATSANTQRLLNIKLDQLQELCRIMESDKLYSVKDLKETVTHVKARRLYVILKCDEAVDFIKVIKKGRFTFFKKI
tara:strand:+ start:923 stop:1438 length:516 start_codon:yes stop_codon:yes gene_type:complete